MSTDNIYASPQDNLNDFSFDSAVVNVFPDMIKRSVPGYAQIIDGIGHIATRCVTEQSNVYDLGCSLGAASLSIAKNMPHHAYQLFAVDNSSAMITRAQEHFSAFVGTDHIQLVEADILDISINNASMVVLNFTLQFLPPRKRQQLIDKIYQGLNPGGVLIISEKFRFDSAVIQPLIDEMHLDFKRSNGYSELEISQKRSALENVMKTDTQQQHEQRLQQAGFEHISVWHQVFNFASMVAIK